MQDDKPQTVSCLVTELCPYGDFLHIMNKTSFSQCEILARSYFKQLAKAVQYLHSNSIAHLDIKPDNLLLGPDFRLKLADFDSAHVQGDKEIISRGSHSFRAPEIAQGTCKNPQAADIYSLGCVLFTFITGMLPYKEKNGVTDPL
mmetsp:Transcript_5267/g.4453  ORF Transcript_5267/g.4453 Transcript_5267/m.4453 type:complete len:145 (+) Transcript_5267:380-814(+)